MVKRAGSDHYEPISWDDAFRLIAERLNALDSPDRAAFYTSGRTSNEAAFVYQLFVRAFGTNNLPDCSNMCHESTGTALNATIGIGKSTVAYDDFAKADLVIVMGQNPGTNHPRMLGALEETKRNGGRVVSVNVLPEAGLIRYKNPQKVRGILGKGTEIADRFLQIRAGGDMALLQAVSRRVLDAEDAAPGTVLDHGFLAEHTVGLDAFRAHLADLDEAAVLAATGLAQQEIDDLAAEYLAADRVIITWAMGLTQQRKAVATIKEIVNLLLLRGNIGKPGAGASPIRGHSNVQGDRTMGIWERMPERFLAALEGEFGFPVPRKHGADALQTVHGPAGRRDRRVLRDGRQLRRRHLRHGRRRGRDARREAHGAGLDEAQPLPRRHRGGGADPPDPRPHGDRPAAGASAVRVRRGQRVRRAREPRRDPTGRARTALRGGDRVPARRRRRSATATRSPGRRSRTTTTSSATASRGSCRASSRSTTTFAARTASCCRTDRATSAGSTPRPAGRSSPSTSSSTSSVPRAGSSCRRCARTTSSTRRSTASTTDTGASGRAATSSSCTPTTSRSSASPTDSASTCTANGPGSPTGCCPDQRLVAYPTARGCAAAYFPEANVLVPLESAAEESNTPVSKAVIVRLVPRAAS